MVTTDVKRLNRSGSGSAVDPLAVPCMRLRSFRLNRRHLYWITLGDA